MSQNKSTDQIVVIDQQMHKREERMSDGRLLIYYTFSAPDSKSESESEPELESEYAPDDEGSRHV